ncbi:integral membrane sensor signal transduction histidine kinase [Halothece sp. PCC 7418]|uniref:sensor histidine kinase n=1 Tax=Halothece sp. (strain PCC 7418) TaxID=65093 RepID=UPI0002A0894E|nr:HAMP domain-containing sensor histidine kinase [Halothece sp. PCC 7418]AFZ44757.1 integral membrane sensor signal transduction histidine kinase [Halothece sp. PCC 7418]
MFQTTRRRLALWYATVTAVLLLLFATGVYFYVRSTLIERVDDTLKHVVEVVERSLMIQPVATSDNGYRLDIETSFGNDTETVEDDHIDLEWFNPEGELVWSTFSDAISYPLHKNRSTETVHLASGYLLRQVTEPIQLGKQTLGYLRVSHPWFEVTKPIRQLLLDLTIGISAVVVCVAGISWWLSGIAIQPVKESYQSLKQFTADASHELRNPIAMIQTNVQMALAYPDGELQQQQLQVIERLTQRLGKLVNDLLFLARSDSGMIATQQQSIPLDALLMEVMEEQSAIAQQKGIKLNLHLPESETDTAFSVKGDWDQLARLFTNLISNGIEHSDQETVSPTVTIEVQQIKRNHHHYLQVDIKDTGKGIPETAIPHLFDRFYRVSPYPQDSTTQGATGAGLGLAIAQAIVQNHHGDISVSSFPKQGTTFTVTLPENSDP